MISLLRAQYVCTVEVSLNTCKDLGVSVLLCVVTFIHVLYNHFLPVEKSGTLVDFRDPSLINTRIGKCHIVKQLCEPRAFAMYLA